MPHFVMVTCMPPICLRMRRGMNYPVSPVSLLYAAWPHCSTCLPCFLTASITHTCKFGSLRPTVHCFVCLGCVVSAVLPSSSLPSPLLSGLQLVCFALLPEFRLQSQKRPRLLVFPVMKGDEGVNAVRMLAHDKNRPLQAQ